MFVDLMSHVERSMHEAAHVFPAVDHLAHQPSRPTATDAERMKSVLSTEASVELRDKFEQWCTRQQAFLDAAGQLEDIRRREADPDYQAELDREIEALRARRADLLRAADQLRECVARELDA